MKTVSKKLLSIMLVAILLVSAVPFQAFAHDGGHVVSVYSPDTDGIHHSGACQVEGCTETVQNAHSFDSNGYCSTCNFTCSHPSDKKVSRDAVAATCTTGGKTADTYCGICNKLLEAGTATAPDASKHNVVSGRCTNPGCPYTETSSTTYTLTLDAQGGTLVGTGSGTATYSIAQYGNVPALPDAVKPGYTFLGWFLADNTQLCSGAIYTQAADVTAYARFSEDTNMLTVRVVLNGNMSGAKSIYSHQVTKGTNLLNFLKSNVTSAVRSELALHPGMYWEGDDGVCGNFYDFSGSNPLTSQAQMMDQAQTVYVNFRSNGYTLYFNPNGGSVSPTSKAVYFGSAVGTLPTPYKSGSVFQGWKDETTNQIYTAETVYNVAGNTSLKAMWQDEALVILYVYINGDFSTCNRMISMDGFVKNNNISRSDVVSQVQKYYTPSYGYLNIAGLFDEYTWSSYRANTSKTGVDNIQITGSHVNKIYVMVTNANTSATTVNGSTTTPTTGSVWVSTGNGTGYWTTPTGTTTVPSGYVWVSTGNGTGYWAAPNGTAVYYGTNPKTGDTAMLEAACAVMVLAAGALVTVMALRKRRAI